jgi:membrane peptidoglycan carboxypeptidase
VSVRLTLEVGPAAVAKTAYRLGIASKLDANASWRSASEVSLIELTSAYAPFANGNDHRRTWWAVRPMPARFCARSASPAASSTRVMWR